MEREERKARANPDMPVKLFVADSPLAVESQCLVPQAMELHKDNHVQ
jgi:hypothetical protein